MAKVSINTTIQKDLAWQNCCKLIYPSKENYLYFCTFEILKTDSLKPIQYETYQLLSYDSVGTPFDCMQ